MRTIREERPSVDVTQMATALLWAERSTCERGHVGAVIAMDGRTVGTGFNGAPAGMDHCVHTLNYMPKTQDLSKVGTRISPILPLRSTEACRIAIHAETNAIAHAARHGVAVAGGTLYVTMSPCYPCAQLVIAAGLTRVVYNREYRDKTGIDYLRLAGITVEFFGQ